jgi:hypothetical protein
MSDISIHINGVIITGVKPYDYDDKLLHDFKAGDKVRVELCHETSIFTVVGPSEDGDREYLWLDDENGNCYDKHFSKLTKIDVIQVRYDMIGVFQAGIKMHPQEHMKQMGYKLLGSEPIPIGDCWIFDVESIIEPLSEFLTIIPEK